MIDLYPKVCNLCGGEVVYISNAWVYGKEYGSGRCYFCTKCGAYVGTHKVRPMQAMGILADKEMRDMKMKCHDLFDAKWKGKSKQHHARDLAYTRLAKKMGIPKEECHFGYFDIEQLNKAYKILEEWK